MAKISGGANSFLLRALVQSIVDEKAIPAEKVGPVIGRFKEYVDATETAKKNPAEVLRHVGQVLAHLYPLAAGAEVPKVELVPPVSPEPLVSLGELQAAHHKAAAGVSSGVAEFEQMKAQGPDGVIGMKLAKEFTEAMGIPVSPPSPAPINLGLDPADIDLLMDDVDATTPPSARSALQEVLEGVAERFSKTMKHPFIETLTFEGKRYVVVGTATVRSAKKEGVSRSANATVKNYRRIKEADESILVHIDGRPMCATRELENGVCFVWLLHHTPGLVIRFWLNESDNGQRKDNPKGTYRISLVTDEPGWKKAA